MAPAWPRNYDLNFHSVLRLDTHFGMADLLVIGMKQGSATALPITHVKRHGQLSLSAPFEFCVLGHGLM